MPDVPPDENERLWEWHRDQAIELGFAEPEAEMLANMGFEAYDLRRLDGCPLKLIVEILV